MDERRRIAAGRQAKEDASTGAPGIGSASEWLILPCNVKTVNAAVPTVF